VERGTIDFTNPRAIVPDLDLSARTTIAGYDITLEIAGTPETVKATLSSDPILGQSDIASLLVTGRRTDQVGGAGTEIARDQLLGYLSGETLGFAARAVGLDTLRLEREFSTDEVRSDPSLVAGDVNPAARLTLSKRLSRTVEVTLSQNLRDSGQLTWIAAYQPGRALEIRTVSRDDRSRSYELRHSLAFAGPPPEAERDGALPDEPQRISEVRFTGDPGAAPGGLLRGLDLQPGDRFDFYRWQDDRARLRNRYLDRGYLEAQVRATRDESPPPGPGTVLEYAIDPGPLTRLEIAGAQVPAALVEELRRVWSNAVLDEALRSDVALAVRRHFVRRNYLRAEVAVSIPPAPEGEKHVRVEVTPGEPSTARQVQFVGNSQIATDRLEALLDEAAEADAWLSPATLAREVEALYHDEGFLSARADARAIVFEGARAVLPLHVEEGPPFAIAGIALANVRARSEAEVRAALGLQAGDRYTAEAVGRARAALETDYAAQGFNAVSVTLDATADAATGSVAIVVDVDEGPRQILETVAVDGGSGVRPSVVLDALSLETGAPVNMASWYEARRRLLDTGLFQRVDVEAVPVETGAGAREQPVRVQVTLRRWPPWGLRYGLEVTDEAAPASEGREISPGVSADLQRRGLWGRPGTFGVALRANRDDRIGRSFLTLPGFFGLPVASSLFVSRSREQISESGFLTIIADRTMFTAEQRFRPRPAVQVAYGYHLEQNRSSFAEADPDDPLGTLVARQARLTSTVLFDTRDDPFGATRGMLHSSALEYAPRALGADARFVKYVGQQFVYYPLTPRIVAASALRVGAGRGFGQRLIPSERFFAGGVNTVRGYEDDSLGGADFFGDPVGGQATLVLNQEIRFPMWRWLGGVGFVDAGNVFRDASDLSLGALAVGVGAGFRISTPVGLFRLDLGVPVPREDRSPRWHFSFGQMF
jgi:outer membrane protein insertion porin family